jgi:site-specific DNA recombinase
MRPMKTAIYARKSTDDNDKILDNKSITRQVDRSIAYAESKGWTVAEENTFLDDGVSGAEFKNRPGLLRMLNHLSEFDVIVMSELSRLGREMSQTSTVLAQIHAAGVRIYFYLTDDELKFDKAIDKFMVSATAFAAELEREKASQRSRDALFRKAEKGYNAGGRVYGYDNVPVYATSSNGQQVKSHTDYKINEEEAKVINAIFRMYADGFGLGTITKTLNQDPQYHDKNVEYFGGRLPPSPWKGTGSWAPSSVREILHRERYTGKVPYGEYRKTLRGGTRVREKQESFLMIDRPELRIIPEARWDAVQARLKIARESHIYLTGGSGRRVESKYLLSGMMKCECCGASMIATSMMSGSPGKRRRVMRYACSFNNNRGHTVCGNTVRPKMDEIDNDVLSAIEETILTPEAIRFTLEKVVEKVAAQAKTEPDLVRVRQTKIEQLRKEMDRFVNLIAVGKTPQRVLEEISWREAQIKQLADEIAQYEASTSHGRMDARYIRDAFGERIAHFRELMRRRSVEARQGLHALLKGPIRFTPLEGGYELHGETKLGALLPTSVGVASPRRFELLSPP